ncbi:MAG TPA: PA2779 family protein [Thermodesulfobacteriota bacterium]
MLCTVVRCRMLVLVVLLVTLPVLVAAPAAQAAFAPTAAVDAAGRAIDREEDLRAIRSALERRQVEQRLVDLGIDPAEARARIEALSDEEIHAAADQVRALMPGGDGLGLVIGVLIVVLLVIVILKLLGKEIIIR